MIDHRVSHFVTFCYLVFGLNESSILGVFRVTSSILTPISPEETAVSCNVRRGAMTSDINPVVVGGRLGEFASGEFERKQKSRK